MKITNSQLSSDLLRYVLPNNVIDHSQYALNEREMKTLYHIWKDSHQILPNRFTKTADMDQFVVLSLVNKGYINFDGSLIAFTDTGKNMIKKIVLNTEQSAFEANKKRGS